MNKAAQNYQSQDLEKKQTMGGRFGKYGDTKRKAKIRQSGLVKVKGKKVKPDSKPLRRQKKKKPD
jgi:hypothetical protein